MTLLAIVAIHTAANEPPKVRQVMNKIHRNVGPAPAPPAQLRGDDRRGARGPGQGPDPVSLRSKLLF